MNPTAFSSSATISPPSALTGWQYSDQARRQPRAGRTQEAWKGDIATAAALATLALEAVFAYPAVILRITLVAVLTLRAHAVFLPALLICQLYASDFQLGNIQTYDYLLERYEASRVTVFGFPITTNYVFALCLTLTVLHRFASRPDLFRGLVSPWAVLLWCSCFPIAILAALVNLTDKAVSWTAPIRDVMMVGCVFLGLILAEDIQAIRTVILKRIVPLSLCMLGLAWFGFFYARGMYWITSAGPAILAVNLLMRDQSISKWFAFIFATLTTTYTFAIYPTAYAFSVGKALYSDNATTFALKGMWAGALILVPLAIVLSGRAKRQFGRAPAPPRAPTKTIAAWAAVILMMGFPVALAAVSSRVQVELSSKKLSVDLPWYEQFLFKLLYDRAPIYRGAIDEVTTPPFVLKAGTRASYRLMLNGDKRPWPAGSHNLVLEELRRNGWYSGIICLSIILGAMAWACTAFLKTTDPLLSWYAGASFITLLISGLTSHIPMETNASIWLLTPAGISAALYRSELLGIGTSKRLPSSVSTNFGPHE